MKKALLIEDDRDLASVVTFHLSAQGYKTKHTVWAKEGLSLGKSGDYEMIILDLGLPDGDGMDICKSLRQEHIQVPILILTAKTEEIDVILGLEFGADDYMKKPFRGREFQARIKAIARRYHHYQSTFPTLDSKTLVRANLEIDRAGHAVRLSGKSLRLTPKEFDLLVLLASHPGRTFSRSQLIDLVWGYQFQGFEHTVNSLVNRLRAKIDGQPNRPPFINTVWGLGYKFNEELVGMS